MLSYLSILLASLSFPASPTMRAAAKPHAAPASEANVTWTNEDLERLSGIPGLISVVGQPPAEALPRAGAAAPRLVTEDPEWYAVQAASLNARLEAEQANVRDFIQALDDARELKSTTTGINLSEDGIGITPEATIEILRNRVRGTQSELSALEDLARYNNIPPGILRD